MIDSTSTKQVKKAIAAISGAADDAAIVSAIIDRAGFESLTFLLAPGVLADADAIFTVLVEDGDAANLSDAAAVADDFLISQTPGTAPEVAAAFRFDDDGEVRKIGYRGNKRYVRLTLTPVTNTGAWPIAAIALLEGARTLPITQAAS